MKPCILTFGEIIWDIYEDEHFIGGAGLNFAAHCAKCGLNSFLFSSIGEDELGKQAVNIIDSLGINRKLVGFSDEKTGQCLVKLNSEGIPQYHILENTAFDNIILTDNDISFIKQAGFEALYFGTLIQRSAVSRGSLIKLCNECSFKEIICDVNLRENCYDDSSVKFCLENATILKISEEEEPLLRTFNLYVPKENSYKGIAEAICAEYSQIKYVILTLGEKGAFIYCKENETYFKQNGINVDVVSTVGGGDSFIAAWVTTYLNGADVEKATKLAIELSAFVVSQAEAIPDYVLENDTIRHVRVHNVLCDMHIHSQSSHDSTSRVTDIAEACIKNNVSVFAITDHCDIQYYVERDMPLCMKNSYEETLEASRIFDGRVKILKGIEVGEGIWNREYTKEILEKHDYDVVIGSVHAVRYKNYTDPYSIIDFSEMEMNEIYEYLSMYFDEMLEMIKSIPIDIMAHMNCPLRYINGKFGRNANILRFEDKINKILDYIIEHSIAFEINTSVLNTYNESIIENFKNKGGYLVTIGSDSHIPENVGKDFDKAINLLKKYGFKRYYYYEKRKSIPCEI